MKKKLLILFVICLTLTSCFNRASPNVSVKNDIQLTIDGENVDGIEGEWIITSEEKEEKGKHIIIVTIEKNELE
ncbi:MAG: hypothetical protein HN595_06780 [Flavobacteriaceae bacterium]|nr:hypothetical protein [Flavobacteriaceae bacterium]